MHSSWFLPWSWSMGSWRSSAIDLGSNGSQSSHNWNIIAFTITTMISIAFTTIITTTIFETARYGLGGEAGPLSQRGRRNICCSGWWSDHNFFTHFLFKEMYSPTPILIQYLIISSTETTRYYKTNRLEHALALTLEFIQVQGITGVIISLIELKSAIFPIKRKSFFSPHGHDFMKGGIYFHPSHTGWLQRNLQIITSSA